jgi:MoaA/NifB/PqqE/SkfB family radical SAM enzyme
LKAETVLSWIDELDRFGALGIGLGGGEPTAHPDFAWICTEAAQRTGMAVTFTTHSHRLNEELAAAIRGSVHFIRVSMDGFGPTYERLRGRSFAALQRRLEIVASIAPFGLNVVVNDDTVTELDAIASFAGHAGATEVLLLPEQAVGARPGISPSAAHRLAKWASTSASGIRLAISEAGATDAIPLARPYRDEAPLDAHAHVDAQGILKTDAYAADGVPVGESIMESVDLLRTRRTR